MAVPGPESHIVAGSLAADVAPRREEDGHFVGQLFDDGIAAYQCPLLLAQGLIPGVQRVHQLRGQGTKLISPAEKPKTVKASGHDKLFAASRQEPS